MQGNSITLVDSKEKLKAWFEKKEKNIKAEWNAGSDKDYPGRARCELIDISDDKSMGFKLKAWGQKMWTMEFGRGHNDATGEGVSMEVIKSPAFKQEMALEAYNRKGRMQDYRTRFKSVKNKWNGKSRKQKTLTDSETGKSFGGRAFNLVRIFTRKGQYKDLDGVTHTGSGLGGEAGLNTEAFALKQGSRHKGKSLARPPFNDGDGVLQWNLGINKLYNLSKAEWDSENVEMVLEILKKGIQKDITKFVEGLK